MEQDQIKTNSISLSTGIVHDGSHQNERETDNINSISDQLAKFSINRKSWAEWKSISDKLRNRLD